MNWRRLFPLIFLFSCVDGFIINLFYPAKLPFLLKDLLILLVYILFFITRETQRKGLLEFKRSIGSGIWFLAIAFIILGGLQMFNPGVLGIQVGIMGFKTMFFYWPLAILAYAYVDSLDCLKGLMKAVVYFSIPICIFGIYQFWKGPDFMASAFGEGFRRSLVKGGAGREEFLRVFSTFVSSGHFTAFLVINSMFILGLLFTARSRPEKLTMIGCIVLNYVALLCTGSRGGVLALFFITCIFVIFCRWLWRSFFVILLLGISFSFGFNYLGKAVLHRFETIKDTAMVRQRTMEGSVLLFQEFLERCPLGCGAGTASVTSHHVTQLHSELQYVENYLGKLQYELGIIGVVMFYILLIALSIHWFRHWLKFFDRSTYIIISALSAYSLFTLWSSLFTVIDSPPMAIYLWAEVGMVARLATFLSNDKYLLST